MHIQCSNKTIVFNTTQVSSNLLFRLLFHVELSHCMINMFSITFLFRSKHMIVPCGQSIPHSIMVNYRFKCDLQFLLITIVNSSRLLLFILKYLQRALFDSADKITSIFYGRWSYFYHYAKLPFQFSTKEFCVTIIITVFHDDVYFLQSAAMNIMHYHRGKEITRKPNGS